MNPLNLSYASLALSLLLLVLAIGLCVFYKVGMIRAIITATLRMSLQLALIGVFLKYLFAWNHPLLNLAWLGIMILVAVFTAVRDSTLRTTKVLLPVFLSFSIATLGTMFFLNTLVLRLENIFDARYLIVLGGMLLGNSLRGTIVGITGFYQALYKERKKFNYWLALGATRSEAIRPYLAANIQLALKPTIAAMATMGIVALPGMMTGVILGGANPETAIRYQIMIMIGILVSTIISVLLTIQLTLPVCFNKYDTLRMNVFTKPPL